MKSFKGKVLFLDRSDINTDEIIPAKYLTEKWIGLGLLEVRLGLGEVTLAIVRQSEKKRRGKTVGRRRVCLLEPLLRLRILAGGGVPDNQYLPSPVGCNYVEPWPTGMQ